jgi:hypothetical protein
VKAFETPRIVWAGLARDVEDQVAWVRRTPGMHSVTRDASDLCR